MIKSFTVYIVHVSDFGRSYQIERRFDDFAKLHAELVDTDGGIPPIPEKKMWASTDAQTVAERRPAFEKILRYMLRSEECVMEKGQIVWKFLEMPPPAVVAARYMFKSNRLSYARQCGRLLDPKYEKEHAYRLAHESLVRTNLNLLTGELEQLAKGGNSKGAKEAKKDDDDSGGGDDAMGDDSPAPKQEEMLDAKPPQPWKEAEAAGLEMLRWALANGGEAARKTFLEEDGITAMLNMLFKKGREATGPEAATPDPRVRTVLNALVKAEGDHWPRVFADFLSTGGVTLLSSVKDVFQKSQGFADFISKLLWIAWDEETQRAFLHSSHREALGLLSAIFECPSRAARTCAGLLLSCLISSRLLEGKEAQAAAGVENLLEELVSAAPVWTRETGDTAEGGVPALVDKEEVELTAFIANLGQAEGRFGRILACVDTPWRLNNGTFPDENSPLWSCCAFALWCLLKLKPKPSRLGALRPALPAVAEGAPPRVRWLVGELLLLLQLQSPARLISEGPTEVMDTLIETTFQERTALEVCLREQVEHSRHGLKMQLEQNQQVIQSFKGLTEERQRPLELAQGAPWHKGLDGVLTSLGATRKQLTGAVTSVENRRERTLLAVKEVLQLDLSNRNDADEKELERKLESMREIEAGYLAKKQELDEHSEVLREQDKIAEEANSGMERADKSVQDTRKKIIDIETQISGKQRDAQSKRTMASSDFSALKGQIMAEMDTIKAKQGKIRERAVKIQAGEPLQEGGTPLDAVAAQEEMTRLKQESAQLKARSTELQAEQARMDVDPATLEQQARAAEEAVVTLGQERDNLRAGLQDLELGHTEAREIWQGGMKNLQTARHNKELAERECSGLKQQLDSVWASWQPLWAKQLQAWRGRILALSQAKQGTSQLEEAVGKSWESLRSERSLRREVMDAVQELQHRLAELGEELQAVDDNTLEAVLGAQ